MKRRFVILTEIIAPYRIPVFNALAARDEVDLHVIFLAETDPGLRQWQVHLDEIQFSYQVLKSYRHRVGSNPEVILSGGYNYPAMWQAQRWAHRRGIPFLLWSESNTQDARGHFWGVEALKRRFIHDCQGYVVPGSSAASYLHTFGVKQERILVAPNAVDVECFSNGAEQARQDPGLRQHLGLPRRYLLYVGRFVRAKGVFDLLTAYATLPEAVRKDVGLVLAGDGEEFEALRTRSREIDPGVVVFPGFLQRNELPAVYALAEVLVFPTHSDPWGLVVNEAMACGLPVIVSEVAGCVADLVRDGENGYIVAAGDPKTLSQAMEQVLNVPESQRQMGRRSLEISSRFSPEAWADGLVLAIARNPGESRG